MGESAQSTIRIEHPLANGEVVEADELWDFPEGLIGLPDYRRFALLPLRGAEPFRLLCSADDASFGLVLVDPCAFVPGYRLALTPGDLTPLADENPDHLEILVPVVLPSDDTALTLNLKGPIVLSLRRRTGVQRVSPDESHPIRYDPRAARSDRSSPACSS
jgi:flagellar assembly factor FliW